MEEDQDTIAKHIAKAFSKGHVTEQTKLRITVKVEEQDVDGEYVITDEHTYKVAIPVDMRDSFITRMEQYLTTDE